MPDTEETVLPVSGFVTSDGRARVSLARYANKRAAVPVKNALPQKTFPAGEEIDLAEMEADMVLLPNAEALWHATQAQVPVKELQYWLRWVNQMTVSSGETAFDYPNSEFMLGMLGATMGKYSGEKDDFWFRGVHPKESDVSAVPHSTVAEFLAKYTADTPREELVTALDEFVGMYLTSNS